MIPVLAGIALTFKLRGERRVALVYIGDGGTSTGTFHEGMNFAAVQRVPLVVIGEYNHWAYSTPPENSSRFGIWWTACGAMASPRARWMATMCSRCTPKRGVRWSGRGAAKVSSSSK